MKSEKVENQKNQEIKNNGKSEKVENQKKSRKKNRKSEKEI